MHQYETHKPDPFRIVVRLLDAANLLGYCDLRHLLTLKHHDYILLSLCEGSRRCRPLLIVTQEVSTSSAQANDSCLPELVSLAQVYRVLHNSFWSTCLLPDGCSLHWHSMLRCVLACTPRRKESMTLMAMMAVEQGGGLRTCS